MVRSLPEIIPVFPYFSDYSINIINTECKASLNSVVNSASSFLFDAQQAKTNGRPEKIFHSIARSILCLKLFSYSNTDLNKNYGIIQSNISEIKTFGVFIHLNSLFQKFFASTFVRLTDDLDRNQGIWSRYC